MIWFLSVASLAAAQNFTLSVFDFNWSGKELSLSNEIVADSAASVGDGISFHPKDPLVYY